MCLASSRCSRYWRMKTSCPILSLSSVVGGRTSNPLPVKTEASPQPTHMHQVEAIGTGAPGECDCHQGVPHVGHSTISHLWSDKWVMAAWRSGKEVWHLRQWQGPAGKKQIQASIMWPISSRSRNLRSRRLGSQERSSGGPSVCLSAARTPPTRKAPNIASNQAAASCRQSQISRTPASIPLVDIASRNSSRRAFMFRVTRIAPTAPPIQPVFWRSNLIML